MIHEPITNGATVTCTCRAFTAVGPRARELYESVHVARFGGVSESSLSPHQVPSTPHPTETNRKRDL